MSKATYCIIHSYGTPEKAKLEMENRSVIAKCWDRVQFNYKGDKTALYPVYDDSYRNLCMLKIHTGIHQKDQVYCRYIFKIMKKKQTVLF